MIRTHLSPRAEPFEVQPREQAPEPTYKPKGLWYEVDGDWQRWCAAEEFGDLAKQTIHHVEFGSENMLLINTLADLDAFNDSYATKQRINDNYGEFDFLVGIRWAEVAERWDGIEIAPYQWTRRLEYLWYYGWDCASGVIWRPRGVTVSP